MKKIIIMLLIVILCCSFSPVYVKAVTNTTTTLITSENNPELWERFLKYDLCIFDYDSLDDEQKDLCKFIFETELNSDDTIICERARRILNGYDVGRRVTLEDTEIYYDFIDFSYLYNYVFNINYYEQPYLYSVPDIKHIDFDMNYNEYWLDDSENKKILSTGEIADGYDNFADTYEYVEQDENGKIIKNNYIERCSIYLETISDENFTYIVYPDNTLYVLKANSHLLNYEIPEEINGMKVVGIKNNAFSYEKCYDVVFPESIKYIEPFAFSHCSSLKSIILPKGLKFLGSQSFSDCTSLKNITVDCPDLICETPVFNDCKAENVFLNFKSITSYMLSIFDKIENVTFGNDVIKLGVLWTNSKFMKNYNYTIPETIKVITNDIFSVYDEYYSEDLIIPETIKIFGAYSIPASGKYSSNLSSSEASIAVIDNKCCLSFDTIISGYYGTEAHNYALLHNIKFKPIDDILYGDTNKDEKINIADLVLLQDYLLHNSTIDYEADMNKDGRINVFDLISIKKYITKNIEE